MCMVYLPTFTIHLSQMWVNIPYMDPMGTVYQLKNQKSASKPYPPPPFENFACTWQTLGKTTPQKLKIAPKNNVVEPDDFPFLRCQLLRGELLNPKKNRQKTTWKHSTRSMMQQLFNGFPLYHVSPWLGSITKKR